MIRKSYIYIYIYIYTNQSTREVWDTRSVFIGIQRIWIQIFHFPRLIDKPSLLSLACPSNLHITGEKTVGFLSYLKVLLIYWNLNGLIQDFNSGHFIHFPTTITIRPQTPPRKTIISEENYIAYHLTPIILDSFLLSVWYSINSFVLIIVFNHDEKIYH